MVLRFNIWTKEEIGERIAVLHELIVKACLKLSWIVEAFATVDIQPGSQPLALVPLSSPKVPGSDERVGTIFREVAQIFRRGFWPDKHRPFADWFGEFDNCFNARRFEIIKSKCSFCV